ncbi:MAG: DNA-directed RNA polymerase subunit H [Nanoarchaeota archaeon]
MAEKTEPIQHEMIPKHEKLSQKDAETLLSEHNIAFEQLPCILKSDPALRGMDVAIGDIIKITRTSQTSGITLYYRGVVDE